MNDRGHLSDVELDLLGLGTLEPAALDAARAHLDACERCRTRHAEHGAARERFESIRAASWRSIEARAARPSWSWLWKAGLALLPVAAALLLVLGRPGVPDDRAPGVKGDGLLHVYALHQGKVRELRSGDRVAPGDRIRFAADAAEAGYLLVVCVDGAGKASVWAPFAGERSMRLAAGRQELPDSIELDETPGAERIFVFFSSRELLASPLLEALAKRPSPEAVPQPSTLFVLAKESP